MPSFTPLGGLGAVLPGSSSEIGHGLQDDSSSLFGSKDLASVDG